MATPSPRTNPRFWEQLAHLNETAPEPVKQAVVGEQYVVAAGPRGAHEHSDIAPDFAYLKRHIVVRNGTVPEVQAEMRRLDPQRADLLEKPLPGDPARAGVKRFDIGSGQDVLEMIEQLRPFNARFDQPAVTPDYLIGITGGDDGVSICPAGEPVPAGAMPIPAIKGRSDAGCGVRVLVVDTGFVHDAKEGHDWIADVDGDARKRHEPSGDPMRLYYGHGTFIAGVLKCVAPGADVVVSNVLSEWAGAELVSRLGGLILDALDDHYSDDEWPDIISLSAGTSTLNDEQLLGFQELFAELGKPEHRHTVLVAAAGNDGRDRPFWPAAFAGASAGPVPGVVSVGALREDGQGRACFSNYGDWVKVFAPGERLVNVFPRGEYQYVHSHRKTCRYGPPFYASCGCIAEYQQGERVYFDGMAQWSGTSFATPVVAGLIAARKWQKGGTAREAATVLTNSALPVSDLSSFLPEPFPKKHTTE